jgi:hypothetical protein
MRDRITKWNGDFIIDNEAIIGEEKEIFSRNLGDQPVYMQCLRDIQCQ